jgi:glucosamine--fructose-6-phosphate aminotransferase (isomerizing)
MVAFPDPKTRHPFHMHAMIRRQPEFVQETLDRVREADVSSFLPLTRHLIVTGCGTSFHAAMYGARILQALNDDREIVEAVPAYDLAQGTLPRRATVLGVSHSGSTPTTNRALARAKRHGLRAAGLCGLPNSEMARIAHDTLVIGSTHDRSWANTMSYTTQLAAFAAIAAGRARDAEEIERGLRSMPRSLGDALGTESAIRGLASRVARRKRVTFLGTGWDDITALEAALKIRETCSLTASAYHAEQFLHGPFLSLDRNESIVFLLAREDATRAETIRGALSKSGATVTTIGENSKASIRLPRAHPHLRPILSVIPLQFLAYYTALARRVNPDVMRTDIPRLRAGVEALFH